MKKKIYGIYTILFIIIFGFILFMFIVRGNGMISTTDGYHQTFPILVYIKKYINIKAIYIFIFALKILL